MATLVEPVTKRSATVKKANMLVMISSSDNRVLDKQWHRFIKIVKRTPNGLVLFEQLLESLSQPTTSEDIVQPCEGSVQGVSSNLMS